jgi:ribosomal protein S18 acetylase RimI-like enzyme
MSASLILATAEHMEKLLPLVEAFQAEEGLEMSEEDRRTALTPLLEGVPHGAVYLIGPARAPIGYITVSFGWSLQSGGLKGHVEDLYIRKAVRGRGIATDVLLALPKALAGAGLRALHVDVEGDNEVARKLYLRTGFKPRDEHRLMTRTL